MTHLGARSFVSVCLAAITIALVPAPVMAHCLVRIVDGRPEALRGEDAIVIAADRDDDDDDGTRDGEQTADIPMDDTIQFRARAACTVDLSGSGRLLRAGVPVGQTVALSAGETVAVQFSEASRARLQLQPRSGAATSLDIHAIDVRFLDSNNREIDARTGALRPSQRITNDATLPRRHTWDTTSPDSANFRIELRRPGAESSPVTIESLDGEGNVRSRRTLSLQRSAQGHERSPFLRLVGDAIDAQAPGVSGRVLQVAVRDRVVVRVGNHASQSLRVFRPPTEDGGTAARFGRLRVRVLRASPGGVPAVGTDAAGALRIAREQVAIANEVWMQCGISFGDPHQADIEVVDPPVPSLLAVADGDGFPARGGGEVWFRADGRTIGPVVTQPQAPPLQVALEMAAALERAGFRPTVTENPPTEFGAGATADVLVRRADGSLAVLRPLRDRPLSSDARQRVEIGQVDLSDGLQEFDNMTAAAGTLEERALIKALADEDPRTIELFIVNRFASGTRQGEAFIESDGGAIVNTVILDRNGIRQQREAWTQSHEVGHVLLDQPFHPDNVGPDEPWRLMDADSSLGLVTGPKRLTADECLRARQRSGIDAVPALLGRQ